jgi:membrane fusion protein (multidrug efflux system)
MFNILNALHCRTKVIASLAAITLVAQCPSYAQAPGGKPSGEQPPQKAGYIVVEKSEVPVTQVLTGRAVSKNRTQVRPRVGGVISSVLYSPGSFVEEGTPLFAIDPVTYEIAVSVAQANVERSRADFESANASFDRAQSLQGSVTSKAAREQAEAAMLKAKASLSESEANLRLAETQLEWTTVRAPISGVVDVAAIATGDLVTASQATALAEIVQTDPVYVDLTEPYPVRLRLQERERKGEVKLIEPELSIVLDNGNRVDADAKMLSTSASVSTTTGSRTLRFEMANPQGLIAPGMFLQAELKLGRTEAVLVPQRATTRERDGTLIAWVDDNGQARKRRLQESGTYETNWVILSGVEPGEKLLIDGTNRIRDGQKLDSVQAYIDELGVVRDLASKTN